MQRSQLIQQVPALRPLDPVLLLPDVEVTGIESDSRKVQPGTVFVCLKGEHVDGHQFILQALTAGAAAVVVQKNIVIPPNLPKDAVVLEAPDTYQAIAELSSAFYGHPGKALRLIGVTGTNGKTTVTHLVDQILTAEGQKGAILGTLGIKAAQQDTYESTGHTTPMAPELQKILAGLAQDKLDFTVMEVSSHALDQHRVAGCDFEVAILTNVTQDHLDYHKTMAHYWQAKAKLFASLTPAQTALGRPRVAVINADSDYAAEFVAACPDDITVLTYGIEAEDAKIKALDVRYSIAGVQFTCFTHEGVADVKLKLAGKFSVYNALAAIATCLGMGVPLQRCVAALESVPGVRGRFEVVSEKPYVIVDYAHTPDGLENVLVAARHITPASGKLIAVFGCGGDRDATKRPKMGAIAERLADTLVITSDNPRTEDPQQILTDIISGLNRFDSTRMAVNADRRAAIRQAIDLAQADDIIVVAGKGHEDYQILGTQVIHFDDREEVQTYIREKHATPSL